MSQSVQFSSSEQGQFEGYRPPNVLAIASLAVAIVSGVALCHPMLSVVCILAVMLAALALLPSRADAWGRPCALFAMGLALFFASFGNTWYFYRRAVLFAEARKNSESWLRLMADEEYQRAHQLTLRHFERAGPGTTLDEYYGEQGHDHHDHDHDHAHDHQGAVPEAPGGSSRAGVLDSFKSRFPISKFIEMGDFGWRFDRVASFSDGDGGEKEIQLRYTVFPTSGAGRPVEPFSIQIVTARGVEKNNAYWRVANVAGDRAADL